jgi:hypothetical protein
MLVTIFGTGIVKIYYNAKGQGRRRAVSFFVERLADCN